MDDVMEFLMQPWVLILLIVASAVGIFLSQIFSRKKYDQELNEAYDEEYTEEETNYEKCESMIRYQQALIDFDKKRLIGGIVVFAIYLVGFILTLTMPKIAGEITISLFVATIVFSIIFKDPILKFLWKIPTWNMFLKVNEIEDSVTTGYSGTVDSSGHVSLTRDRPILLSIIFFFLAMFLFMIKLLVITVYITCSMFGNVLLCSIVYPLFFGINIGKNIKVRNFFANLENNLDGDKLPEQYADIFD